MDIFEKVQSDMKDAMRAGEAGKERLGTLRILLSELKNEKINSGKELDSDSALAVVSREAKKRRQAAEEYKKMSREDMAEKELGELKVLEEYLPEQMNADEVSMKIKELTAGLGELGPKDLGKVMGIVMKELRGKADGNVINAAVKALLGS